MRGHIRMRSPGSYALVIDLPKDEVTGKRRQKWITVKGTKRQAERRLAEVLRELNDGEFFEASRMGLGEYLDQWMADYVDPSVRVVTAEFYRSIVRQLQAGLGGVALGRVTASMVQRYYAGLVERGLSAGSVRTHHQVLSQAMRQAVKWDLVSRNVMERVTPPRLVRNEMRVLDLPEVLAFLGAASGTDQFVVAHLAIYTGLRRSEVCGLRWSDVDLEARRLTVVRTLVETSRHGVVVSEPKTRGSRRSVSFSSRTEEVLREHRELLAGFGPVDGVQVCANLDGSSVMPKKVTRRHVALVRSIGLEGVRFHDLRHTHASILLAAGVPVHVVQARLGHRSIRTTVDTYGHIMPGSDELAGNVVQEVLEGYG